MKYIEKYATFVSIYDGEIYTYDSELTIKEPLMQSVGILRKASEDFAKEICNALNIENICDYGVSVIQEQAHED